MSCGIVWAYAASTDAAVNSTVATMIVGLRPQTSASRPYSGIVTVHAKR